MSCENIRELIPAYVMGTASAEEVLLIEMHLVECDLHDDIASMGAASALYGSSSDPIEPPDALKSRVMAHVAGDAAVSGLSASGRSYRRRSWIFANPIAALLVVALGAMAVWNIMLQGADSPERFVHYYWGNDNDWMRIETVLGEQGAEVSLGGVDRLDDAYRYHLWTTRGEQVFFVGSFNVNPEGRWAGEFEFVFLDGDRVWMTLEPASGSEEPTGDVVLRTRF
jgi:hypothetical protein